MAELDPLDDRLTATSARMRSAGHTDQAEQLDACAAYIREAWRGADVYEDLAEDLQRVADNAAEAARLVLEHQDRL